MIHTQIRRVTFSVTINVLPKESSHEKLDWLRRYFSYYHQGLEAVIKCDSEAVVEPTAEELLGAALLEDAPDGADLLGDPLGGADLLDLPGSDLLA